METYDMILNVHLYMHSICSKLNFSRDEYT